MEKMNKSDEEWKKKLDPEAYRILRERGTEAPFSGKYYKTADEGMYACAACGSQLFSSDAKFESKEPGLRGWPSFDQAIEGAVEYKEDNSSGMRRTEVVCAKCGSHLGHLFEASDSKKTGKHFCINSACLNLEKK